jgi:hypothetical protein
LLASARHLSEHLGEAPVLVLACIGTDGRATITTSARSIRPCRTSCRHDQAGTWRAPRAPERRVSFQGLFSSRSGSGYILVDGTG